MKSEFYGHNYIVVFKYDNGSMIKPLKTTCKVKPFKTLKKAEKYFYKILHKCIGKSEWYTVTILDTMGKKLKRVMY